MDMPKIRKGQPATSIIALLKWKMIEAPYWSEHSRKDLSPMSHGYKDWQRNTRCIAWQFVCLPAFWCLFNVQATLKCISWTESIIQQRFTCGRTEIEVACYLWPNYKMQKPAWPVLARSCVWEGSNQTVLFSFTFLIRPAFEPRIPGGCLKVLIWALSKASGWTKDGKLDSVTPRTTR